MEIALWPSAIYSGTCLLILVVGLGLLNSRKRLPFLPLGSLESWLQVHIYGGLFSGLVFAVHTNWRVPQGRFEVILAASFVVVFISGVIGLAMSRFYARQLTTRGGEVVFDRIAAHRKSIHSSVESLVMDCLQKTDSTLVPRFFADRLNSFFLKPRYHLQHVLLSRRPRLTLLREIESYQQVGNEVERATLARIAEMVVEKDRLDFQYALQLVLKLWLMVHIPASCALFVFAALHVLLVLAFTGGF